jgi:hypothetical protein
MPSADSGQLGSTGRLPPDAAAAPTPALPLTPPSPGGTEGADKPFEEGACKPTPRPTPKDG